ncbi:MAG: ribonuclease E activity regulator RraA [Bacteroidota bacterium]
MAYQTADIWDEFEDKLTVLNVVMNSYGKLDRFHGQCVTMKVYEDNTLVKKELQQNGQGKVLVVDGGGSRRCALIGDNLAQLAIDNEWSGVIIYGCIRDSCQINDMPIAVKALGTCPAKSHKRNEGIQYHDLIIEGTQIQNGDYVYADADGILIAGERLK